MSSDREKTAGGFFDARCISRSLACHAVLALICSNTLAVDQTYNISFISEEKNPSLTGSLVYGDVWVEGGYAYVGTDIDGGGMNIFSLANPRDPVFIAQYPGDQFEDVEVWDGVGYFASDTNTTTGTGVDIVDLSIPSDPLLMSRFNGSDCNGAGCGHNKVHTLSIAKTFDNRSFLYTTDNATDVVKIVDVTTCATGSTVACNPQLARSVDLGLAANIASHEVIVRNDRMFVASKNNSSTTGDGWVSIYNVAEPTNPVLMKKFASGVRSHTALPSADGKILVVAEEHPDNQFGYGPAYVKIYDISNIDVANDLDNPTLLSTITAAAAGIDAYSPHHPHLHGNLLFLPWYESGLQVFNIADPAHPAHVGSFDTYPGTSTNYNGNWGVDLSMGLDTVYLSDRTRGLIVVDARGVLWQGDYNQDMKVDALDYTAWRNSFGTSSSGLHTGSFADGNDNGVVDAADYVLWRKRNGQTGPTPHGAGAGLGDAGVPEPASLALVFAATGLLGSQRRRGVRS